MLLSPTLCPFSTTQLCLRYIPYNKSVDPSSVSHPCKLLNLRRGIIQTLYLQLVITSTGGFPRPVAWRKRAWCNTALWLVGSDNSRGWSQTELTQWASAWWQGCGTGWCHRKHTTSNSSHLQRPPLWRLGLQHRDRGRADTNVQSKTSN